MSDDPILERLTQFTPSGGRLDRDALLFAAGRASGRPNRGWRALAGMLAASQVLTLAVLFWPRDFAPVPGPGKEVAPIVNVVPPPSIPDEISPTRESTGAWTLLQFIDSDGKLPPPESFDVALSADKSLFAFGPLSSDLLK